jgi:hypothetical protein
MNTLMTAATTASSNAVTSTPATIFLLMAGMVPRWAERINGVHPVVHTNWKHQGKTRVVSPSWKPDIRS